MTRSRQRSAQTEEIARKLEIVLAELASLRILLAAHGIGTPRPLDADYLTVQRFAVMNHISPEAALSRIRRGKLRAEKRGGRWWVKCTVCTA
ncbi:fructosamine-3-kinase [Bradyrhizobium sp. F1.4.3]